MHNLPYRLYSFLMKQCNRLPYLKFTLFKGLPQRYRVWHVPSTKEYAIPLP